MNPDRNAFYWSVPLGTWFAVRVRMSVFFPIVALALAWRLQDAAVGLAFAIMLFVSVVLHEFGHVLAARLTGGDGEEILITPIGGLAGCMPASTFQSRFWTVAGGPLANVMLSVIALLQVVPSGQAAACLNPLDFPAVTLTGVSFTAMIPSLVLILFKVNWLLLLINLLPVHPLDGGRMLQMLLMSRLERFRAQDIYAKVGVACGMLLLFGGLWFDNTWVMLVGSVVLVLNLAETFRMQTDSAGDESFMGYDFSQGYTSLDRDFDDGADEADPGLISRWKNQRDEERRRREEEEERRMEARLDELLDKLHTGGQSALTASERRQLEEISAKIRNRGQQSG